MATFDHQVNNKISLFPHLYINPNVQIRILTPKSQQYLNMIFHQIWHYGK